MRKFKNESAFTRWFCEQLRKVNAETVAFVGSSMQRSGIPDRYVRHRDFGGWLEFKKDRGKVGPTQRDFMTKMIERGDTCFVIRFLSETREVRIETADGEYLKTFSLDPLPTGKRLVESLREARIRMNYRKI